MSEIIQGSRLALAIRKKVEDRVQGLSQTPGLAAILVGDDPASHLYVSLKERAAKEAGIYFERIEYPKSVLQGKLLKDIRKLNKRDDIHGILVQLPLPNQDENAVVGAIDSKKDVDGFHKESLRHLFRSEPGLVPPVALAILKLIEATRQPLQGKTAIIIGNHKIFAEPIIHLMKELGIEASFTKRNGSALSAKTRAADIVVVAIGEAAFLTKDMVKEGGIVIDVGTNKIDRKTIGDAAEDVVGHAGFISPVPGGVGPLTVAYLLNNVVKAMILHKKEETK
jgi:methylenetetrahydrofolate dehydrogenase (NADP+)/methenyltetrahydrofolate cyclohydrolase